MSTNGESAGGYSGGGKIGGNGGGTSIDDLGGGTEGPSFAGTPGSGTVPLVRNDIVKGNGGLQILLDDPSGNPIELFQAY